ncbi:MAG TPA: hypothetical protein VF266_00995, partial [Thermoanaerobaculia bacterium]
MFFHRCGVALLLAGNAADAMQALMRATALSPTNAAYWSDRAFALESLARQHDAPQFLPDALAATDHSLRLDADFVPALFNRASTLASMGIFVSAIRGYETCARLAPNTPWAREASRRVHALRQKSPDYTEVSLEQALASPNDLRLEELCRSFTPRVIAYTEDVLLVRWADHTLDREPAKAQAVLRTAQRIARALHRAVTDTAVTASLTAIDGADEKQRLALATGYRLYGAARHAYATGLMHVAGKHFQAAAENFHEGGS